MSHGLAAWGRVASGWRFVLVLLLGQSCSAQSHLAPRLPATSCQKLVFEGEVAAGKSFEYALGSHLAFYLEATRAGWIVRVNTVREPRLWPDYAQLATPPYQSMTPLALTTDYSFRAQDVIGWNPRRFQFLTSDAEAQHAIRAYSTYMRDPQGHSAEATAAIQLLTGLPGHAAQGEVEILDAHIVPGMANQSAGAGLVASHFRDTPHTLDQPADGKASALGTVDWLRFRATLYLPANFVAAGRETDRSQCGR